MKYFDKLSLVIVQFDFPQDAAMTMVDKKQGQNVNDKVWLFVSEQLKSKPQNLCCINDVTNGFDYNSIRFELFNWETKEELEQTIAWLDKISKRKFNAICKRKKIAVQ